MTTRRAVARDESRAEVMLRAATAMARHGYHGMSMRDLAKSARRSLASSTTCCQSKEDILFELQRTSFESLIESAEAVLTSTTDPDARLDAFVDNHVRFFVEKPDVMRVLVVEASALPPRAARPSARSSSATSTSARRWWPRSGRRAPTRWPSSALRTTCSAC